MPTVFSDITSPRDLQFAGVDATTDLIAVREDGSVIRLTMADLVADVEARIANAIAVHEALYTHVEA
jgi:hypothetical protein